MTRLKRRLVGLIEATGPIPVNEYMAHCLFDPRDGYYTTREPFGALGDFITAPEVSQMFGELVAIWLYSAWNIVGRPLPVTVAEIGPGRGTLMKDMLRVFARLDSAFARDASFALVETSPRLAVVQKQALVGAATRIEWHEAIATLPKEPLLIVGNELFDAVPMRQFIRTSQGWRERAVGLTGRDELCFVTGAGLVDSSLFPYAAQAPDGAIVELAPAREALMSAIAAHIAESRGAGLTIDYGHIEPSVGDTFQAIRKHRHEHVLASPGEADLTSHVDFAALAAAARRQGLDAHLATQGSFLFGMGLAERAEQLGATADAATRERLAGEVERLAAPGAMGELFKVLAVLQKEVSLPPFNDAK